MQGRHGLGADVPFHMTDDRLRHIRGVAEMAYRIAFNAGFGERQAQAMFVLGFVHDVGYGLAEPDRHAEVGGAVLAASGYDFAGEVALHGVPSAELTTTLSILDLADFTVDGHGDPVTLDERLADIRERHGEGSRVARVSEEMVARLRRETPGMCLLAERLARETRDQASE